MLHKKMLEGLRVVEQGAFITGPYAAMLLADMGADVIKVERPEGGDPFRNFEGGLYSALYQAEGSRHLAFARPGEVRSGSNSAAPAAAPAQPDFLR